jgi:hypothetical protein
MRILNPSGEVGNIFTQKISVKLDKLTVIHLIWLKCAQMHDLGILLDDDNRENTITLEASVSV